MSHLIGSNERTNTTCFNAKDLSRLRRRKFAIIHLLTDEIYQSLAKFMAANHIITRTT